MQIADLVQLFASALVGGFIGHALALAAESRRRTLEQYGQLAALVTGASSQVSRALANAIERVRRHDGARDADYLEEQIKALEVTLEIPAVQAAEVSRSVIQGMLANAKMKRLRSPQRPTEIDLMGLLTSLDHYMAELATITVALPGAKGLMSQFTESLRRAMMLVYETQLKLEEGSLTSFEQEKGVAALRGELERIDQQRDATLRCLETQASKLTRWFRRLY